MGVRERKEGKVEGRKENGWKRDKKEWKEEREKVGGICFPLY